MNNKTLFSLLFTLLFCLPGLIAQPPQPHLNITELGGGLDPNDEVCCANDNCCPAEADETFFTINGQVTFNIVVRLANVPDEGDVDPLYVVYDFGFFYNQILLLDFDDFSPMNNQSLFQLVIPLTFDMSNICSGAFSEKGAIPYSVQFLTINDQGQLVTYPVEDYINPGEIFSYEVFDETFNCSLPGATVPDCIDPEAYGISGSYSVCCACEANPPHPNKAAVLPSQQLQQTDLEDTGIRQQNPFSDLDATIFPNPFQDNFRIGFELKKESQVTLRLTDLSGKVLTSREATKLPKGPHQMDIEQANLPVGVYLCYLEIDGQGHIFKVVKE